MTPAPASAGPLGDIRTTLRTAGALVVPMALVALVVVYVAEFTSFVTQSIAMTALVKLSVVIGLYIFSGNSGVMSFGHLSFMAIGAYVAALLTIPVMQKGFLFESFPKPAAFILHHSLHPALAAVIAGAVAAAFAVVVGIPLMRMSGFQASIATLALLIVVSVVISNWESVTHGTSTMIGVPMVASLWNLLAVAEGAIVVAFLYQRSWAGLRLRAVREDPYAAAAMGIDATRSRLGAFVLSAFVVGVGGAMYAYTNPFSANDFYLTLTFYTVAVLVIGGRASLWGAALGATIVSTFTEVMRVSETGIHIASVKITTPVGTTEMTLGVAMLVVLLTRPAGLTGGREASWPWVAWAAWRAGRRARAGADRLRDPGVPDSPVPTGAPTTSDPAPDSSPARGDHD